jgi:hypothetical protein
MTENTKSLSDAQLVAYLEQLSGKRIRKREDISAYVAEISQRAEAKRSKWQSFKNAALSGLFVIAVLQYYYLDVALEILDQPTLTVFVPTTASPAKPYL